MKSSEIPSRLFTVFASKLRDKLEPNHLGGTRTIAPLRTLDGWVVLASHPEFQCSSCKLFQSLKSALKDCWPICGVQVGPHDVGWDDKDQCSKRVLRASFFVSSIAPPKPSEEARLIATVQHQFSTLSAIADPEEFLPPTLDLMTM